MPEMVRTWIVPASATLPELRVDIREPPLTGDNLGLKTWGTAFAIVKKLEELGNKYFDHLLVFTPEPGLGTERLGTRVLELGSGTGLVGISAGAIWGANVLLTDLPEIQENLLFNISKNALMVECMGGSINGDILDWKDPKDLVAYPETEFEVV